MQKISGVIITYNEESNIERCVRSLMGVVDEVVVLDSFSADATADICKRLDVRFYQQKFINYGQQKSDAVKLATYDWVLSLDADEVLSDDLRNEIIALKSQSELLEAYTISRRNFYCGIPIYRWYADRKLRLFDKQTFHWSSNLVHEVVRGPEELKIGQLKGELLHYAYNSVAEHEGKLRKYALLASEEMVANGKHFSVLVAVLKSAFRFFKVFFLRLGFLDGKIGFNMALLEAKFVYWKYSGTVYNSKQ